MSAVVTRSGRRGAALTVDGVLDVLVKRYAMTEAVAMLRQGR